MKYILISLLLSGCSILTPATIKFPEKPKNVESCASLKTINDGAKLSDLTKTVSENYASYHECNAKLSEWNEWYDKQRKIFEKATR